MGNKNSRSRLTRSFEQFDPVAPASCPSTSTLLGGNGERPSSASGKVAPSPSAANASAGGANERGEAEASETEAEAEAGRDGAAREWHGGSGIESSLQSDAASAVGFDFSLTEGQTRRTMMAEVEFECSKITPFLFLGGAEVAKSWDVLEQNDISLIINCAASAVESRFENKRGMTYVKLHMVDGRQDDISWFVCEVAKQIQKAVNANRKVLLHCEKGISRSCSFAIAYQMLSQKISWKEAFDDVKSKRAVCNPNTAFTCNLMEIGELASAKGSNVDMLLRLSSHLPHDAGTPILKPCRDAASRRLLPPSTRLLDPSACFVIRPGYAHDDTLPSLGSGAKRIGERRGGGGGGDGDATMSTSQDSKQGEGESESEGGNGDDLSLYVWYGEDVANSTLAAARGLAEHMVGIFSAPNARIVMVQAGNEPAGFWRCCANEGPYGGMWTDLFPLGYSASACASAQAEVQAQLPPTKPPRSAVPMLVTASTGAPAPAVATAVAAQSVASALGGALGSAAAAVGSVSTERLATHRSSTGRLSRSDSMASNTSSSRGFGVTLQSPHLSPDTSTASITRGEGGAGSTPSLTRRTPSTDKYPREPGLIREPTPVEDLLVLAGGRANPHTASGPASASATALADAPTSALPLQPSSGVSAALLKPRLFQAVEVTDEDADTDCPIRVHGWQGLGVYDDDDLSDMSVLLLLCPPPGPHFLWVGRDFDLSAVVELELEDIDEEHLPLRQWACRVLAGEAEVLLRGGLQAADVVVVMGGEETEDFWASWQEGF